MGTFPIWAPSLLIWADKLKRRLESEKKMFGGLFDRAVKDGSDGLYTEEARWPKVCR